MVRPKTSVERITHTTVDTISFSVDEARSWRIPDVQREVRVNKRVMALSQQIRDDDGVIPGIVCLGVLDGITYLIDGQQRREAFFISEKKEGYADVRTCYFKTHAEMGEEFVKLNSQLVKMTPDDVLRGLEASVVHLKNIRVACPFVGYSYIRKSDKTPVLSMCVAIRCWMISKRETPSNPGGALDLARNLTEEETEKLISFLKLSAGAWGRDEEYWKMWNALNLTICMWLYRRLVTDPVSKTKRSERITQDLFKKCMMALSANSQYMDWLVGRRQSTTDRSPCYQRVKAIFARRLSEELGRKILLPQPAWSA